MFRSSRLGTHAWIFDIVNPITYSWTGSGGNVNSESEKSCYFSVLFGYEERVTCWNTVREYLELVIVDDNMSSRHSRINPVVLQRKAS